MNWFLSIFIGLLSAIVGCISAGVVAALCVRWYRLSSFEGSSGYLVVFTQLLGIFGALIAGIIFARVAPSILEGLGLALGSTVGFAVVSGVICRLFADPPPTIDGQELEIAVEIQTPVGFNLPVEAEGHGATARVSLTHGRTQPAGDLMLNDAKQVDGRWIITATVPLQTSAMQKHLHAYLNKEHDHLFWLPVPPHPQKQDMEWSRWVEGGGAPGQAKPAPENNFHLRCRVQFVPSPPPEKTPAEYGAEAAAADQAKFDAIAPDAPIVEWLPYTKYGTAPERLERAITHITSRVNFVEQLTPLLLSPDREISAAALYMLKHVESLPETLAEPVAEAGRRIAEMIHAFNATTPGQDSHLQGVTDISAKFASWRVAIEALRTKGIGDFTAELEEILRLARVREDSYCLRMDVVRVASYYLKEWAGVEPLPSDPPPR